MLFLSDVRYVLIFKEGLAREADLEQSSARDTLLCVCVCLCALLVVSAEHFVRLIVQFAVSGNQERLLLIFY